MKEELIELRKQMVKHNIDAYMIPTTDYHGSEYVNDYFKCRKFISGFSGSAGTLVITREEAYLWTDGRYFLQAAEQLSGTGIDLMKMGQPDVPTINEYLKETLSKGQVLAFDGRVVSGQEGRLLEMALAPKGVIIRPDFDLVDDIWSDRPAIEPSKIYEIPLEVTGKSCEDKLKEVRKAMTDAGASYHLISNLEEIAWLLNLRGNDVANTPVFFAFALVGLEQATIYLYKEALNRDLEESLKAKSIVVKDYLEVAEDLKELSTLPDGTGLIANESQVNYTFIKAIPGNINVINQPGPIELMKAIKNPVEIKSTKNAHVKDGVAMVNFIYWLKSNIGKTPISEMSAADYLEKCRRSQEGCNDLSFTTISGYGPHGAIIHYDPTPETNVELKAEGFLLVDSGGQYTDGTTDITRTIALGPLTDKMKEYYTAVLASHIELAMAQFQPGTTGIDLDTIARKPLHVKGLDFNHGTGHGVGHLLSVHEWPNNISPRMGQQEILPGMITSDEPGVYIENEFGIRLENEILCIEDGEKYKFEPITYCPFDREAILAEQLTPGQLNFLNSYHKLVLDTLAPHLEGNQLKWLEEATVEIQ